MPSSHQQKRAAVLRRLLRRGVSLAAAGKKIGLSKSHTWRLANRWRLPRRRRGLSDSKRRQLRRLLQRGGLKQSEIARRVGVDRSTVSRHRRDMFDRADKQTAALQQPIHLDRPRTCDDCGGRLLVWPCLACKMRGNRSR